MTNKLIGTRQGSRVRGDSLREFTAAVRDLREAIRELVQCAVLLVASGVVLGVVIVSAAKLRLWLG
ncbi:MAG: hypothetical protein CMJ58_15170 [Planctomycetaceae bacterium]|nr:hypothetical protein [Planctomycetaceae bacterium]